MKIDMRKHLYLIGFIIFTLLMSTFGLISGCSKKGDAKAADDKENANAKTEEAASLNPTYEPIQEKILASIRESYSAQGIEIVNIELSSDMSDQVRIDIKFPDHSEAQAVLAGLYILHDNFPKMKGYHATAGGEEYSATTDVLTYISGQGYTLYCLPDNAEYFMEFIKNGIPADSGEPVNAESH